MRQEFCLKKICKWAAVFLCIMLSALCLAGCRSEGQNRKAAGEAAGESASEKVSAAGNTDSTSNAEGAAAADMPTESDGESSLQIVCTIFPPYDFARAVAGNAAEVTMLLKPGEEVHSYEPTPQDIRAIQNCDLFIYVGGENDVWVDQILENLGEEKPKTLRLVDLVDTVEEEQVEGMMPDREESSGDDGSGRTDGTGAVDGSGKTDEAGRADGSGEFDGSEREADEHVWTSPKNAAEITGAIAREMAKMDPADAAEYEKNALDYEEQIMELDAKFGDVVRDGKRRVIVFGDRFPMRYFAEEFGLEYYAAFSGCSSDSEPNAATLAFLIDKVRDDKIPVVFSIEFSNGNIARAICESTGAVQRTFYSCHNVTRDQFESGATYVSLMYENLEVLREALN